ncbi:hypothetical protein SeLEV6574_g07205 [Synchytrium endobioticum]|uniref:Uncharacterized protein n=1 Tax=Synchytrium endobioticum TaxID=286115 RepID=A0A507CEF2_9FUNG|nr:hypothetical protein SeLEV6574_g07205 [Synchytrium endobioticum]
MSYVTSFTTKLGGFSLLPSSSVDTVTASQHRQVSAMSRLSKIHIAILIVVFLVHRIQAVDDSEDDKKEMRKLSSYLMKRRVTKITQETKTAQNDHDHKSLSAYIKSLPQTLAKRRNYVPRDSPKRDELSRAPAPGDSREWQDYMIQYNAYQYGWCEIIRLKIVNAQGLPFDEYRFNTVKLGSRRLAEMMKRFLSLEVLYSIALGEMAPHLQTILDSKGERSYGNELGTAINELRAERARIVGLINGIRANPTSVSLDGAMASVWGWPSLLSPEELSMEPTPNITDDWLHYIMEYNALVSVRSKYKLEQLRVLLKYSTDPKVRGTLLFQQELTRPIMGHYFATSCRYAQEVAERAVYASLPLNGARPPFEVMDGSGGGNEVYNSEGNVPGASSECVAPADELNFDFEFNQDDWNMVLPVLEGPSDPEKNPPHSYNFEVDPVDKYWTTGNIYYKLDEDRIGERSPPHNYNAYADEAGSSSAGIASGQQYFSNEKQYGLDKHK